MPQGQSFSFPHGEIVSIVVESGAVYIGTILGIRHHNEDNQLIQLLFIRLARAVGPYYEDAVVAINVLQIESIGPVAIE